MAASRENIEIKNETFSLLEIPSNESNLVIEQKKLMLNAVDLNAMVEDLKRVGSFVRLAYNGVAGYTELQISIREIGVNVTKLCDKSNVTVTKFKMTSGSILTTLQSTYQFLLHGHENLALKILDSTTSLAKDMVTAAEELQKAFEEEANNVEEALKKTTRTKGTEEQRKKDLEKMEKQLHLDKEKAKADKASAEEGLKQYELLYKRAEEKQESYESSSSNPLMAFVNGLLCLLTGDTDSDKQRAQQARGEKLKHLEEMKKQRELHMKALEDLAEFSKKIEQCKDDAQLASVAINALHKAMGALHNLSAIMMKTAHFWKLMQFQCEQITKAQMQTIVKHGMELPKEERLSFWTENSFKKPAIEYYGKWVALDDICGVLLEKIKGTQTELYNYLIENPTLDEARANVRELAKAFAKDIAEDQKAITEKGIEGDEMIKQLKTKPRATEEEPTEDN